MLDVCLGPTGAIFVLIASLTQLKNLEKIDFPFLLLFVCLIFKMLWSLLESVQNNVGQPSKKHGISLDNDKT